MSNLVTKLTSTDADALILQLERTSTGAHQHTRGKAIFYLLKVADKPNAKFSNCSVETFVQSVRNALYRDEWKELGDLMGRWW